MPNSDINGSNKKSFQNHLVVQLMVVRLPLLLWPLLFQLLLLLVLLVTNDLLCPYLYYYSCEFDLRDGHSFANRDVLTTNIRTLKCFGWLVRRPKMPPKKLTIPDMSLYR